jgi:hypothetical protein
MQSRNPALVCTPIHIHWAILVPFFSRTNREQKSQVKLLITNDSFCIVQRATAQSKARFFRGYGVAEAPPGFQAGWSDCMYFFYLFLFILFAHLELMQPRHSSP